MVDERKEYTASDCVTPANVAENICNNIMPAKAGYGKTKTLVLSIAAGAFIAFGAQLSMTAMTGSNLGFGLTKLIGGIVFAAGLIMVVLMGAELFTGNVMMTFSVIEKKMSLGRLLRSWGLVYLGNFIGSVLVALLVFWSGVGHNCNDAVGAMAVNTAHMKMNLPLAQAFVRAILCNWLVCIAIWMALSAKTVIGKIFSIIFPITTFCASGFEHSIANMFFLTDGMLMKSQSAIALASGLSPEQLATMNLKAFFLGNLIPVTLGNIVGAFVFIVLLFWTAYIRNDAHATSDVAPHPHASNHEIVMH